MIAVLAWTLVTGLLARELLPGAKPKLVWVFLCALAGWLACYAVWHGAIGAQEMRLSSPECLLPALGAATALLWAVRRLGRRQRRTLFF